MFYHIQPPPPLYFFNGRLLYILGYGCRVDDDRVDQVWLTDKVSETLEDNTVDSTIKKHTGSIGHAQSHGGKAQNVILENLFPFR